MPQLDPSIFPSLIFWLVLNLAILYGFLRFWGLPRLEKQVQARKKKLDMLIKEAEELWIEAEKVKTEAHAHWEDLKLTLQEQFAAESRTLQEQLRESQHQESQALIAQERKLEADLESTQKEIIAELRGDLKIYLQEALKALHLPELDPNTLELLSKKKDHGTLNHP